MSKRLPGFFRLDRRRRLGLWFDRLHGVETTGVILRDELAGMAPELRECAGDYAPTHVAVFTRIASKSRVDLSQFTFVDLGSGKGRIVIAAADYPFDTIVGVEADAGLHQVAMNNLKNWRASGERKSRVSFVHSDARTVELPSGNLFVFMYSPFRGIVFQQVAERLASIAREPGRAMVIAYSADWEAKVLEQTGAFTRVRMPRRQFWKPPTVSFFYNEAAERMRR